MTLRKKRVPTRTVALRSVKITAHALPALQALSARYRLNQSEILGLLVERWTLREEPDIAKECGIIKPERKKGLRW